MQSVNVVLIELKLLINVSINKIIRKNNVKNTFE